MGLGSPEGRAGLSSRAEPGCTESSSDHFPEGRSGRPSQEGAWQPRARCPLGGTPQATEPSL